MAKNIEFINCKKLIYLYLKGNFNYGKEVKIAKKLLSLYPMEFFESYHPNSEFLSLSVFLTKAGLNELSNQFSLFKLSQPKPETQLEESPQIELNFKDSDVKKPKTLRDFVDGVST